MAIRAARQEALRQDAQAPGKPPAGSEPERRLAAAEAGLREAEARAEAARERAREAMLQAREAEQRAAESAATAEQLRAQLHTLRQSSSWRLTLPLRLAAHLLRARPGALLLEAGIPDERIQRLRRVAGPDGRLPKRLGRIAFYASARVLARLPGAGQLDSLLAERLPGPWKWLRLRHEAYLASARATETGTEEVQLFRPGLVDPEVTGQARYRRWIAEHEPPARAVRPGAAAPPVLAFLIVARPGEAGPLRASLASLLAQGSGAWQCLVGLPEDMRGALPRDSRITALPGADRQALLARAEAPFVALLDPGDVLAPAAVQEISARLAAEPELDLLYSDEDRLDGAGQRCEPLFKPSWSPDLLRATNYFGRLAMLRRALVQQAGGWDAAHGPAAEWDLHLRLSEASQRIARLTRVLCHRGRPAALDRPGPEQPGAEAFREALRRHWARQGIAADVETTANGTLRARWEIAAPPLVSVIIPNKDKPELLRVCLDGLRHGTAYPRREIIVVDNDSADPRTHALYAELTASGAGRVVPFLEPFNYSAACNRGAAQARGELLLFLNNDIEITDPDWLDELVRCATLPGVGVVGTNLIYPDGALQHAGVVVGMHVCGLVFRGFPPGGWGVFGSPEVTRNWAGIMGACQMVPRAVFEQVGGFDETYRIANSDVALSLHAWRAGLRTICTPFTGLVHHEGASRGKRNPDEDMARTAVDIRDLGFTEDPFFHPGLSSQAGIPTLRLGVDPSTAEAARLDAAALLAPYPPAESFDLFDPAALAAVAGQENLPAPVAAEAVQDRWSAAAFCLGLLYRDPALRARFPRALTEGATGGFAAWLAGEGGETLGLAAPARALVAEVFAAPPGARTRQIVLTEKTLLAACPLGLTPAGQGELLRRLFAGLPDNGLRGEEILWFALECAEDPAAELVRSWFMLPAWQRAAPEGMTRFGRHRFAAWLAAMYGLKAEWARPENWPEPLSPADQLRLAWHTRPAWQRRFPAAMEEAGQTAELIEWLGSAAAGLPDDQRAWCAGLAPEAVAPALSAPGLNVIGHFSYASGLRTSVESLVESVRAAGQSVSLRDVVVDARKDEPIHARFTGLELYDTTLIHVQPEPYFLRAFEHAGLNPRSPAGYRIGYWYWEMDSVPAAWEPAALHANELWTATSFVAGALKQRFDLPVMTLPPGVELPGFTRRGPGHFGLEGDKYSFLFTFHMMSIMERKNPLGLIRAFSRAFREGEPVRLVLKTTYGENHPALIRELRRAAAQAPAEVLVIDEVWSQDETLALMDACDAYVSLHRSEGLGLTMIEAMLLGKPVVATGFSGNTDFMSAENSLLVDYRVVPIGRSVPPYEADMRWAEPDEAHAARLLRQLYEDRAFGIGLGARARKDMRARLSFAAAGRRIADRLEEIREMQRRRRYSRSRTDVNVR